MMDTNDIKQNKTNPHFYDLIITTKHDNISVTFQSLFNNLIRELVAPCFGPKALFTHTVNVTVLRATILDFLTLRVNGTIGLY